MKFLFDLFPIILFFAVFKLWGIYAATAAAIVATVLQIAWMALRHRKVDPLLWLTFGIVVVFGGATLLLHDETFIKWKPTALYWAFAIGMLGAQFGFDKNPIEAMMSKQLALPPPIWGRLNIAWAIFFVLLGIVNIIVAYHFTTNAWVNFKLFGSTGLMLVFIVIQSLWLGRHIKNE